MTRLSSLLLLGALSLVPAAAHAQGMAVAGHVGSLGLGGSAIVSLTPKVNLRGTVGLVPLEPEFTADEVDFTVDFPVFMRATVDYYALGVLYISAGGLFVTDGGDIDVVGTFTGTQDFGGNTYTAAEVGDLTGTFSLSGAMPYLGVGFGNPVGRRISLALDLGVGFGSVPDVDLGATGPIAGDATFRADLDEREVEIQDDIPEVLKYYPVISLSVGFGFGG